MARIQPIPPKAWPPEIRDALAAMIPPVPRHSRPPTEDRPKAGAVLQTFAHHPELAKAFFTFNGHILWQSSLDPRQREILVLRVAVKRRVAFLWAQHVFEAKDAGLTDEEMSRIAFGPDAPFFDPVEGAMVRAVDELIDDGAISGDTWEVLASELSDQQLLDLVFTVGCYETTSWMFRSVGLEPDPDVPELLQRYRRPEDGVVKPAPFTYHAPSSVEEAVGLLGELGEGAKVLAGGQSLVPMLNLRLAAFDHLIDLGRIEELRGIEHQNGSMWFGAGTTQTTIESSAEVARHVPLLARATPLIGHFQIRNRGTIGGSIAHADPTAEYPAVALALDAELEAASPRGRRTLPAAGFFDGLWTTVLAEDEILTGVRFPVWEGSCGHAVEELARRHGDFAIAGAVVSVQLDGDRIQQVAVGLLGLGSTPERAAAAEAAVTGASVGDVVAAEVGEAAMSTLESIPSDLHGSDVYRRRIGAAMVARAWTRAIEESRGG